VPRSKCRHRQCCVAHVRRNNWASRRSLDSHDHSEDGSTKSESSLRKGTVKPVDYLGTLRRGSDKIGRKPRRYYCLYPVNYKHDVSEVHLALIVICSHYQGKQSLQLSSDLGGLTEEGLTSFNTKSSINISNISYQNYYGFTSKHSSYSDARTNNLWHSFDWLARRSLTQQD